MYFLNISIKLAFGHLLKKKLSRILAMTSVSVLLILVGALAILHQNLSQTFEEISTFSSLTAFVDMEAKDTDLELIKKNIAKITGVLHVEAVSKEAFIQKFSKIFPALKNPLNDMDLELVPRYLKIRVVSSRLNQVSELIKKNPLIEDVETNKDRLTGALLALSQFKNIILFLSLGLILSLCTLIFNHFKSSTELALQMKRALGSLGAKRLFIFLPFAIEGAIEGLLSGIMAALGLYFGGQIFQSKLVEIWHGLGYSGRGIENSLILIHFGIILLMTGVALGIGGSFWALFRVRKN